MNKRENLSMIEMFKDELASKKLSMKIFYNVYISRKRAYKKTSYKKFLYDLENKGLDCDYIQKGIQQFFKMHE